MWILTRVDPDDTVTLLLSGTFNIAGVADFERALQQAQQLQKHVALDLSRVRFIDRPALQYLMDVTEHEVELVNCPHHVACWMCRAAVDVPED